jgi:large subunit ribosomal protein L6
MSRIGKKILNIPDNVKIFINSEKINVIGPKGELVQKIDAIGESFNFLLGNNQLDITRPNDKKEIKAYHGLIRSLLYNMILGVTQGFSKRLIAQGVGYKFSIENNYIFLNMGFSHSIKFLIPEDLILQLESPTKLLISGIDKQRVGFFAAKIRDIKPPEPYKGKGIRYEREKIIRKAGKTRK